MPSRRAAILTPSPRTNLSGADLSSTNLSHADLSQTDVGSAVIAYANVADANYAARSAPPDLYLAGLQGLESISFPEGQEVALVQLRDLLQKAGLRDLERDATFAIEGGRTKYKIAAWRDNLGGAVDGLFRVVAFDWTTRYGRDPGRALRLIAVLWALLIPIYGYSMLRFPSPATRRKRKYGIYILFPKDRVEVHDGKLDMQGTSEVRPLRVSCSAAVGWSAYFSLLSAFQIGYKEFSVASWLTRAQPQEFSLGAVGWVRVISGAQSLLSVYLFAMWLLTYFGRPFQ
jgi:hypothetical protein